MGAWSRLAQFLKAELDVDDVPGVLRERYRVMLREAGKRAAQEEREQRRLERQSAADPPLVDAEARKALADDVRPVDVLPLKTTTLRALAQADVQTVAQFAALPTGFVAALPGIGPRALDELRAALVDAEGSKT